MCVVLKLECVVECCYSAEFFIFSLNIHQAANLITKKELLTMDPDTDDGQLVYEITTEPKHGFLESKLKPGSPITTFTQGTQGPSLLFSGLSF